MKIDLIVCNPSHLIYPLWNKFIQENRFRFNKVIICLTDMGTTTDYKSYLKETLSKDDIIFLDIPRVEGTQDWRNEAVNAGLRVSTGDWVFFTEQDFIISNPEKFWGLVEEYAEQDADAIGYLQGDRLHPCCVFIKRFILNNFTSKDFGIIPDVADHFSKIQIELERAEEAELITLFPLTEAQAAGWCEHLNGLSQNLYMLQSGQEPNYNPPEFKNYCRKCLELPDLHPGFRELFQNYLKT